MTTLQNARMAHRDSHLQPANLSTMKNQTASAQEFKNKAGLLQALQAIVVAAQDGKIVANHYFFTESALLIKQAQAAIQSATL